MRLWNDNGTDGQPGSLALPAPFPRSEVPVQFAELNSVQHDHYGIRQSLGLLRIATSCTTPPPPGHAFWSILRATSRHLAGELPAHMAQEETTIFKAIEAEHGLESMAGLRAEHRSIADLLAQLAAALDAPETSERPVTWASVCHLAHQLEATIERHMAAEERLMRHLARGGSFTTAGQALGA